jgi:hypothetical protein
VDFNFELGLLGQVVHCPACQWQGVPGRDDVELSDFIALGIDVETLVRRLRNAPYPSIPIPPPIPPASMSATAGKRKTQTDNSMPPKSGGLCVVPAKTDSDRRILPTFLLCLLFGSFGAHAFYAQRRVQGGIYVLLLATLAVTSLFRASLESDAIHDESQWRIDNSLRREKEYQERADRLRNASDFLQSSASSGEKEQVARDVAADEVAVEHAADQEKEDDLTLQNGIQAAHTSAIVLLIELLCAFCFATFLLTDFIRIIAGAYKDGKGRKITKWT